MNKKLAILAIGITISILLGGYNSSVLFGTQYLSTREGYEVDIGDAVAWWDCNWSYAKKIIIDHTKVDEDQVNFPVLIYNSSDTDLRDHAQDDGDDIAFISAYNTTQYDHELEKFDKSTGELVAWIEIPYLSRFDDTILYMYYGNPDCSDQQDVAGTWNSNYVMVQHLNETSGTHYDSTSNYNNGTVNFTVTQGTTESNLLQMNGLDFFSDGTGYINFDNDSSLRPDQLTLEAWVKDPPASMLESEKFKSEVTIVDKQDDHIFLIPKKLFHVERTITADADTDLVFVALFSPGISVKDITIDDESLFEGTYVAGEPGSSSEQTVETIRKQLPEEVQDLTFLAYSKPFTIKDTAAVSIIANSDKWCLGAHEGRISYLLLSEDGAYDVECTTHWSNAVGLVDFSNIFSFFKKMFDISEDKDSEEPEESLPLEETSLEPKKNYVSLYATEIKDDEYAGTQTIYSSPIAYYDENGALAGINTTVQKNPLQEPDYEFGVEQNIGQVYFRTDPTDPNAIKLKYNQESMDPNKHNQGYMSWSPKSLQYRNNQDSEQHLSSAQSTDGCPEDNQFFYPKVFGNGTNLTYTVRSSRVKEVLTIYDRSDLPVPRQDLLNATNCTLDFDTQMQWGENLKVWIETENEWMQWDETTPISTYNDIRFTSPTDELLFRIPIATAYDSENSMIPLVKQLKKESEGFLFTVKTPVSWLYDQNTTYPIHIDPQNEWTTNDTDGHVFGMDAGANYEAAHTAKTGTIQAGLNYFYVGQTRIIDLFLIWRAFLFFDSSSIPDNAVVLAARLQLKASLDASVTEFNIQVQNGQPTSPHEPLEPGDYDYINYSGNGGTYYTRNGWTPGNWYNITLTSDGCSWINKEGTTKLCLRSSRDIGTAEPTGNEYVGISSTEDGYGAILNVTYTQYPTVSNPGPANGSKYNVPLPTLNVTVDDPDNDWLNVTWWSNSSGEWLQFAKNSSISTAGGAVNISQTNSNFTDEFETYYWSVNCTDGNLWTNETYHFATGPPYIIDDGSYYAFQYGTTRGLAKTSNGDLHCVYRKYPSSIYQIFYAKSTDNGQTWTETQLTFKSYHQYNPSIAVDDNDTLWIVWYGMHAGSPTYYQIRYMNYTTTSGWSIFYNLTSDTSDYQYDPATAIDSGDNLHIVWHGQDAVENPSYYNIRYAKITNKGVASTPIYLTNVSNEHQYRPSIAIDSNDNLHVVWYGQHAGSSTYNQIRYKKRDVSSGWGENFNFTSDSKHQQYPCIAINSTNVLHVVWYGALSDSYYEIRYSNFPDLWPTILNVTNEDTFTYYPSISIDRDDDIHVVWFGRIPNIGHTANCIRYRNFTNYGAGNPIENITTTAGGDDYYPSLMWAMFPDTNYSRPRDGYALGWGNLSDFAYFYRSSDLSWIWPPIVVTNASTGVEETNATLRGYLQLDGGENCTAPFEYWKVDGGGIQEGGTQYPVATGDEFEDDQTGLNEGELYAYRACANNSKDLVKGDVMYFLTKPKPPSSIVVTTLNQTQINLAWAAGAGANNTCVVRKKGGYPSDRTDGTVVYNDTGSSCSDTGLDQKTRYYYRAWSYTKWTYDDAGSSTTLQQWSDSYASDNSATTTLRLINCSTDRIAYGNGETVTFTAWVHADVATTVVVLLANSTANLSSCNYTNRSSCIANSSNITITSQPQQITATMTADDNATWYAKVYDSDGRRSYVHENTSAWNKNYEGNGWNGVFADDIINSMATDANNNVYVVGYGTGVNGSDWTTFYDMWIMKFDSDGNRLWNKTFGSGASSADSANSVAVDSNSSSVYVVGYGTSLNGTSSTDWWIKKFNTTTGVEDTGNWNKTYTGGVGGDSSVDVATGVAIDSNDNVYVVGYGTQLNNSGSNKDWWIMKFNSEGDRLYNKTYDGRGNVDTADSVAVDSNDNVWVVGCGYELNSSGTSDLDWWIMKFNSDGTRLLNLTYRCDPNSGAESVAIDSDDNVHVVGTKATILDWWMMKFNSDGTRLWNKTYSDVGFGVAYAVTTDSGNNVFIGGFGTGLNDSTSQYDWRIKSYDSAGSEDIWEWNDTYDGNGLDDVLYSMTIDSNDNIYVAGCGEALNDTDTGDDWWIKKFEYITGSFNVVTEAKEILKMGQAYYSLEVNTAGTTLYGYVSSSVVSASIDTDWHYVALTFDNDLYMRLYKDGKQVSSATAGSAIAYPAECPNVTSGLYLTGWLDELRISNVQRDSAWINTSYYSMSDPTSFARFGSPKGVLSTWTYRKKITINSSMVNQTLTNFPLLVYNSSDSNLSADALSTGNDIIFMNSSAEWTTDTWRNKLDHEVEYWNNTTGELAAWVRIPTVSSSADTEIYMYYGNTLCTTNRENITGVWDVNYTMVQHLNESSGTLFDSTINDNDGTNVDGNATYNASAKIDGAYDFDGDGDMIDISSASDDIDISMGTFSAWIKMNGTIPADGKAYGVVELGHTFVGIVLGFRKTTGDELHFRYRDGGSNYNGVIDDISDYGNWHHVVGVYNLTNVSIYEDGTKMNATSRDGDLAVAPTQGSIGSNAQIAFSNFFNGTIDEVRISNISRNGSWIGATFNCTNDTTNFTTFGEQEIKNVAPVLSNPSPSNDAAGESIVPTLSIKVNDVNADCMNISWHSDSSGTWQQFGSISSSATNRFGNDTAGSIYADLNQTIRGSNFTCPANGTVSKIHAYLGVRGVIGMPGSTTYVKAAIYYASNNTLVINGKSDENTYQSASLSWEAFKFTTAPSVTAGLDYYLVLWANTSEHSSCYARLYYHNINGSYRGAYDSQTYNGFPNFLSPKIDNKTYNVYCTYNTSCLPNGTYYMDNLNFSGYDTTYYWTVNCTDGSAWTNETYRFTTCEPDQLEVILRPNADDGTTDWDVVGLGFWHYESVDEVVANNDTDYVHTDVPDEDEEFRVQDFGVPYIIISKIEVSVVGKAYIGEGGGGETAAINVGVKVGDAGDRYSYTSDFTYSEGAYKTQTATWTTNPETHDPWTDGDLDDLVVSLQTISFSLEGVDIRVTQVYVEVTYKAPACS